MLALYIKKLQPKSYYFSSGFKINIFIDTSTVGPRYFAYWA